MPLDVVVHVQKHNQSHLIKETVNSSQAGNSATANPFPSMADRSFSRTTAILSSGCKITSGAENCFSGTESEMAMGTVEGEGRYSARYLMEGKE